MKALLLPDLNVNCTLQFNETGIFNTIRKAGFKQGYIHATCFAEMFLDAICGASKEDVGTTEDELNNLLRFLRNHQP